MLLEEALPRELLLKQVVVPAPALQPELLLQSEPGAPPKIQLVTRRPNCKLVGNRLVPVDSEAS